VIAPKEVPHGNRNWRSHRFLVGTVSAVVLLVAAAAAAVSAMAIPKSASKATPAQPTWSPPQVAPLAAFVAHDRGLAWEHPVAVTSVSASRFASLEGGSITTSDRSLAAVLTAEVRALGLLHGNPDLMSLLTNRGVANVVAAYDETKHQIYMLGTDFTPLADSELVLALTNALDDQYYDLARLVHLPGSDDSATSALVTGDDQDVMVTYIEQRLTAAQRQQVLTQLGVSGNAGESQAKYSSDPAFPADELSDFSSQFGLPFVEILSQSGGNSAIDAAFLHPPLVDSEVMDPALYRPASQVVAPPQPNLPAGATKAGPSEHIGENTLMEMVANKAGFTPTLEALSSWETDQAVGYRLDGRVCIVDDSLFGTAAGAQRFSALAQSWARSVPGAEASANGEVVTLRSCDPGAAWKGVAYRGADPYTVLLDRSQFIQIAYSELKTVPLSDLSCAVDDLIGQVGAQQFNSIIHSTSYSGGNDLGERLGQDLLSCGWEPPSGGASTGVSNGSAS
jgi:hypothetical protein